MRKATQFILWALSARVDSEVWKLSAVGSSPQTSDVADIFFIRDGYGLNEIKSSIYTGNSLIQISASS